MMHLRDFKIGWRLLVKEPAYSAVILLGLATGFAACFLLLGYVRYSLSYDQAVPQAERIYMSEMRPNFPGEKWIEGTPLPFFAVAKNSGLVEQSTLFDPIFTAMKVGAKVTKEVSLFVVHPAFATMFALKPLEGDLTQALGRPDALALTVSQAHILFGTSHAVGKTVEIAGKSLTVAAILPDPPSNSTLSYAALTGIHSAAWDEDRRKEEFESWGSTAGGRLYFKLKPGVAPVALTKVLQDASAHSPIISQLPADLVAKLGGKALLEMRLVKLTDLYFDTNTMDTFTGVAQHGDMKIVLGLAVVAGLILLLAVANYINLATVRTLGRQREIAVRKVLGASVGRLNRQFMTESLVVALIAALAGLLLAELVLPVFADLMVTNLDSLLSWSNLAAALGIGAIVGLATGLYPAWVALRIRPQQTLSGRGDSENTSAQSLRRLLTVLQFSTAMALTSITLAIGWQSYFASHANPGFDPQPLLVLGASGPANSTNVRSMRESIRRLPGVSDITGAMNLTPGQAYDNNPTSVTRSSGEKAEMPVAKINTNFFDVLGLHAVSGRLFNQKIDDENANVIVLSAMAITQLGYATAQAAIGQIVTIGSGAEARAVRIIGVAPEIRYANLRNPAKPILYLPASGANVLTIRASGDMQQLEQQIELLQAQYFPNEALNLRRMSNYLSEIYVDDVRLAKLLGLASLIAIAIAAFGIYVLSAYSVQRLSKQIVLRKLYGANKRAIARLVGREFLSIIAVAALIGLPIAAWAIQRYLANFVEHAAIGGWTLLAAVLIAMLVTLVSTLRHTRVAMHISPAEALRA